MASPSYTYSLTNGTTADASQVMQNYNDILNGVTDGTKDLSISALTVAGTATLNGNINLGNASADDLTITGSLASTIPIKTTNSYDIGSATLGLRALYLGANSQTVKVQGSSSMSATWTMTLPLSGGTTNYILRNSDGAGTAVWDIPNPMASGADSAVSLTVSSNRFQVVVPTANRVYTLPTTSVLAGDAFTIFNNSAVSSSDLQIAINSSGGNLVRTVWSKTSATVVALQATPTTAAHWMCITPGASDWIPFTPTVTNVTGTKTGWYRRVGDSMEVQVYVALTNTVGGTVTTTVPLGLLIDTTNKTNTQVSLPYGIATALSGGVSTTYRLSTAIYSSTSLIRILNVASGDLWDATHPATWQNGDAMGIYYRVPISTWTATGG